MLNKANTASIDQFSNSIFALVAWLVLSTLFFSGWAILSESFFHQTWKPGPTTHYTSLAAYYISYIAYVLSDFKRYFMYFLAFGDTFDFFLLKLDMLIRLVLPAIVSLFLGKKILMATFAKKSNEIIETGAYVTRNVRVFLKMCKRKLKGADGLVFHDKLRILKERETEHILLAGATGAGKTQVLLKMLDDIFSREKDSSLIFDIKGDFTSYYLSDENRVYLLAPWDKRSVKWDVSSDISTVEDARAFAGAFIVSNEGESNSYFTSAAQDVLGGVLQFLMIKKTKNWGFSDIVKILGSVDKTVAALKEIKHAAAAHLDGDAGQTQGVMGSIRAALQSLDSIAGWWDDGDKGFALVDIMCNDKRRTHLILASRADIQETSTPLISAFLSLLIGRGLTLPDDSKRRLWFVLDELGALPKIDRLVDLITLGRSKGLCLIAGTQDLGRLISRYGEDEVQTLSSQFGMQVVGRLGDAKSAEWAASLFGQNRVEREQLSNNYAQMDGMGNAAVSATWQQTDKAALIDNDFLQLKKAARKDPSFHFFVKLTDSYGETFSGKLEYVYKPKSKICEAVILKDVGLVDVSSSDSEANSKELPQAAQNKRSEQPLKRVHEQDDEQEGQNAEVAQQPQQNDQKVVDSVEKDIVAEAVVEGMSAGAKDVMDLLQECGEIDDDDLDENNNAPSTSNDQGKKKKNGRSM